MNVYVSPWTVLFVGIGVVTATCMGWSVRTVNLGGLTPWWAYLGITFGLLLTAIGGIESGRWLAGGRRHE
jgi:hypothetical protein